LGLILLIAACARLILLGATPTLSDDIYRYRWDGRVQQAGVDPYRFPPNDARLASLRDEQFPLINFPHLRTVYPPLTQVAFRLGASLGGTLIAHKAVFVGAELLTVLSVLLILRRRGRSPLWVAAYAWHPLVILEIAGSGHNDALGVAALWIGLAAWQARWWLGCALAWVAAFLSKFLSIILVPWWWSRAQARRWLGAFLLAAAASCIIWPTMAGALMESLSAMTVRFESNASVYLLLTWVVGSPAVGRWLAVGLSAAFLWWWAKRQEDPIRYLLGGVLVIALLSPVLHPWYLVWLTPFFCFWRVPAIVLLTGTVVLSYAVWPGYLASGVWKLPVWAHVLEYAPVLMLGVWELRRLRPKQWPVRVHLRIS
jgi:hypothetical protein